MKSIVIFTLFLFTSSICLAQSQTTSSEEFKLAEKYIDLISKVSSVDIIRFNLRRKYKIRGKLNDSLRFEKVIKIFKSGLKKEKIELIDEKNRDFSVRIILFNDKLFFVEKNILNSKNIIVKKRYIENFECIK